MNLQKPCLQLILFVILVTYFKASILSLVPLVLCVMHLIYLKFIYIQWDKFELCAMLLSNNLICMFMTSFGIPRSPFPEPFCMYMFLCGYISSMVCPIRILYIWERSPFSWYPNSFEPPCLSSIILWWFQICLVSACLMFIGIFTHSCICWIFWLHA